MIGGGPAGPIAAEVLGQAGLHVDVYDAMPSVGRKFLLAGKGGMNLTHAEPLEPFLSRYGERRGEVAALLDEFGPQMLRDWVHGLGIETFVGSSGRVFPVNLKAAPLLRAWLHRLRAAGVRFHVRHRWLDWEESGALRFATPQGEIALQADATVLALGGASWARLGSDGAWVTVLEARGVAVEPLLPSNCGFEVDKGWSEHFRTRFVGQPVKPVVATATDMRGRVHSRRGEFVISEYGVEGSLVYALSALLRDSIRATGEAQLTLDLAPDWSPERLSTALTHPRGSRSLSNHLQSRAGITGVRAGLLRELLSADQMQDSYIFAQLIRNLSTILKVIRPIDEAISSAGGVSFKAIDANRCCVAFRVYSAPVRCSIGRRRPAGTC